MRKRLRMSGRRWLVVGALLTCLSACGGGSAAAGDSRVSGRVVLPSGQPLADARVCVHRESQAVAETTTDSDGRFVVQVEDEAPVRVQVSRAREITTDSGTQDWEVLAAHAGEVKPGSPALELTARTQAQDRVLRLRVVTPDGPLAHAEVRTWPPVLPAEAYRWLSPWPDSTDKQGLTTQKYLTASPIGVRTCRSAPWCPALVPFVLPAEKAGAPIHEIRLVRECLLRGRITDEHGRPIPLLGVMPTSEHEGSERGWGDVTGLDGEFCVGVPESWTTAVFRVGREDPLDMATAEVVGQLRLPVGGDVEPLEFTLNEAGASSRQTDADERLGPEAVRVIEAVLRHTYAGEKTRAVMLLRSDWIDEYASKAENLERLKIHAEESALQDLQRKSTRPISPPPVLSLDVPVLILDQRWNEYWHETHAHEAWPRFRKRFKGCTGLIHISAVGFSANRGQAVLHVSEICGRLNGSAHHFVLELEAGEWRVVYRKLTWLS